MEQKISQKVPKYQALVWLWEKNLTHLSLSVSLKYKYCRYIGSSIRKVPTRRRRDGSRRDKSFELITWIDSYITSLNPFASLTAHVARQPGDGNATRNSDNSFTNHCHSFPRRVSSSPVIRYNTSGTWSQRRMCPRHAYIRETYIYIYRARVFRTHVRTRASKRARAHASVYL